VAFPALAAVVMARHGFRDLLRAGPAVIFRMQNICAYRKSGLYPEAGAQSQKPDISIRVSAELNGQSTRNPQRDWQPERCCQLVPGKQNRLGTKVGIGREPRD